MQRVKGFVLAQIHAAENLNLHACALCLTLKHEEECVLICIPSLKPCMFNVRSRRLTSHWWMAQRSSAHSTRP